MDAALTGQLIAARRKELGLSQTQLAELLHVTDKAVSRWETGRGLPAIDSLEPLAQALGLTVSELLSGRRLTPEEAPRIADAQLVVGLHREHRKLLLGAAAALLAVLLLLAGWLTAHWATSAAETDPEGLRAQVLDFLDFSWRQAVVDPATGQVHYEDHRPDIRRDRLRITQTARRGGYLAALATDDLGHWAMAVLDRDPVFPSRWRAGGGKPELTAGSLGSWNYGSPAGEAVLIFCGGQLLPEAAFYRFRNAGISYTVPIRGGEVLDVFVVQDGGDSISSDQLTLLDADLTPLPREAIEGAAQPQ